MVTHDLRAARFADRVLHLADGEIVAGVLALFVGVAMIATRLVHPLAAVVGHAVSSTGGVAARPGAPERGAERAARLAVAAMSSVRSERAR